jgi:hypothetical protein
MEVRMKCPICQHNEFRTLFEAVVKDPFEEMDHLPRVYNFFCDRCGVMLYMEGKHLDWTGTELIWNEQTQKLNYKPRPSTARPRVNKSTSNLTAALRQMSQDELIALIKSAASKES